MRPFQCFPVALITALLAAAPAAGLAAPPDTPTDKEVRALLRQGNIAASKQRVGDALAAWRAAYELRPDFENACNIGRVAFRIGDMREAAEFLLKCVRSAPPPTTSVDKERQKIEGDEFATARREVSAVTIKVSRDGAKVRIDGRAVGRSPLSETFFVEPGSHRIEAELRGAIAEEVVDLGKGSFRPVDLTLEPPDALPPAPPPKKSSKGSLNDWGFYSGGVLVVGGAGAGAVFSALAANKSSETNEALRTATERTEGGCASPSSDPACSSVSNAERTISIYHAAAVVSFVGAGVATVATLTAYLVLGRRKGAPSHVPSATARGLPVVSTW